MEEEKIDDEKITEERIEDDKVDSNYIKELKSIIHRSKAHCGVDLLISLESFEKNYLLNQDTDKEKSCDEERVEDKEKPEDKEMSEDEEKSEDKEKLEDREKRNAYVPFSSIHKKSTFLRNLKRISVKLKKR